MTWDEAYLEWVEYGDETNRLWDVNEASQNDSQNEEFFSA